MVIKIIIGRRKRDIRKSGYFVINMKRSEKDICVSCQDCIFIRRLSTCKEKGKECNDCKNACCCKKCIPDVSGRKVRYELRHHFDAGMPIIDYVHKNKHDADIETCQETRNNSNSPENEEKGSLSMSKKLSVPLQEDDDGQMSLFW